MIKKYIVLLIILSSLSFFRLEASHCIFEMEDLQDTQEKYRTEDGQWSCPLIKAALEQNYCELNKLIKTCNNIDLLVDAAKLTFDDSCIQLIQKRIVQLNCPELKEDSNEFSPQIRSRKVSQSQQVNPALLMSLAFPNHSCT
jgi:hypothetical protein